MFDHFRLLFFGRNKIADGIEDIASDDDGFHRSPVMPSTTFRVAA